MEEAYVIYSGDNTRGGETNSLGSQKSLVMFRGWLDTVDLFSARLREGFMELGYKILELDLTQGLQSQCLDRLLEYARENTVTAMIGFNNSVHTMILPSGENMCETLRIPSINILVDHPHWYHGELVRTPANGIVLCVDRNHMNYINRFYPNISCNGFLAHGGTSYCTTHKPISERKIDVLYAGGLHTRHILKDFSTWDFPAKQIVEHLFHHPEDTLEAAVEETLLRADLILSDEQLRKFITSCTHLEHMVGSYYRERVVGSIAKAGISLELYGSRWEGFDWVNLPNVHYGGKVAPEEILSIMEDSKIVLNSMPWFKDGSHERVFNAMLCGAVAVSETSKYLEEVLSSDTWVSFDLSPESHSALPQRIMDFLSDEDKMQKIASAGHNLAVSEHTWKARALVLHNDLLLHL